MPVIANCPGCGGPLSETSVLALAPVCNYCHAVIINVGGTLGLTGVYSVNDQSITRRRIEADLSVLRETLVKYNGMKEACKEQLNWGVERYAELPQPPELLKLQDVPPLLGGWVECIRILSISVLIGIPGVVVAAIIGMFDIVLGNILTVVVIVFCLVLMAVGGVSCVSPHFQALAANGERPRENARRQEIYEKLALPP